MICDVRFTIFFINSYFEKSKIKKSYSQVDESSSLVYFKRPVYFFFNQSLTRSGSIIDSTKV